MNPAIRVEKRAVNSKREEGAVCAVEKILRLDDTKARIQSKEKSSLTR